MKNAVYQLYGNLKPSISSSPTRRTFIWIHPSKCSPPTQHPPTRMVVCRLVYVKQTLNLIDCWLNGKSLPLMSWCRPECASAEKGMYLVDEKAKVINFGLDLEDENKSLGLGFGLKTKSIGRVLFLAKCLNWYYKTFPIGDIMIAKCNPTVSLTQKNEFVFVVFCLRECLSCWDFLPFSGNKFQFQIKRFRDYSLDLIA